VPAHEAELADCLLHLFYPTMDDSSAAKPAAVAAGCVCVLIPFLLAGYSHLLP
jgi:hypothetical protein